MTALLVERLRAAATAVGLARYALPGWDGWEHWHEFLWQLESALAEAAEQVHAFELEWQTAQQRRERVLSWIQAVQR